MTRGPAWGDRRRGPFGVLMAHHREHEPHHVVMLMILAGALSLIAAILVAGAAGYVSVASLTVAALFPVWVGLTRPGEPHTLWASGLLALLIVYSHRANIRRLRQGTENRFRTRKGVAA